MVKKSHFPHAGFSIFELVVVIVLLGVLLLATLGPRDEVPVARTALHGSLVMLHNDLRFARETAITREHHFRVDFNLSAKTYTLSEADPETTSSWTVVKTEELLRDVAFNTVSLLNNVLIFDIRGISYEGEQDAALPLTGALTTTETVVLKVTPENQTFTETLTVHPVTGYSSIPVE